MTYVVWLSGVTGWPFHVALHVLVGALVFVVLIIGYCWGWLDALLRWAPKYRAIRERRREEEC